MGFMDSCQLGGKDRRCEDRSGKQDPGGWWLVKYISFFMPSLSHSLRFPLSSPLLLRFPLGAISQLVLVPTQIHPFQRSPWGHSVQFVRLLKESTQIMIVSRLGLVPKQMMVMAVRNSGHDHHLQWKGKVSVNLSSINCTGLHHFVVEMLCHDWSN